MVVPCAAGPALYLAYLLVRSLAENSWAKAHSATLLCFVLPSVVYLLVWMFRSDAALRRQRGDTRGPWVMLAGAVAGAGFGYWLHSVGDAIQKHLDVGDPFVGVSRIQPDLRVRVVGDRQDALVER